MKVNKSAAEMTALAASQAAAQAAAQKAGQTDAAKSSAAAKPPVADAGVTVKVAQETRVAAERAPEINLQKVEAVRTAIERGTFKPNPEVIADKLLAGSREMMNRVRGRA